MALVEHIIIVNNELFKREEFEVFKREVFGGRRVKILPPLAKVLRAKNMLLLTKTGQNLIKIFNYPKTLP